MRLLLITYYFPPCGGAAVQRWLKWLPDLVAGGFEVTVLTSRDGDYPVLDESLLALVPPQVEVIRARAPRIGRLWNWLNGGKSSLPHGDLDSGKDGLAKKTLVWLRLNLIIPDLRVFWNPSALKAAREILRRQPVEVVITTGPPHSTHLVGLKLKKRFGINWVADWRDPWSSIYYLRLHPPSYISRRIHRALEGQVAKMADVNLMVSEYLAASIRGGRNEVIYNGFDPSLATRMTASKSAKFRIKYVGNLTEGQRFDTLAEIVAAALAGKDFELSLVGTRLNAEQEKQLESQLAGKYRLMGFLPHGAALREIADSEVLALLINQYPGSEGMLTTKLFEYLAAASPILCIGPRGGEAEKLIQTYQAGSCFDASEKDQAIQWLRQQYQTWQAGGDLKNTTDVSALSSQNQAIKLLSLLRGQKKY